MKIDLPYPDTCLRPVRESDAADVQLCCNDTSLAHDVGSTFPSPYTAEHALEFVKHAANPTGPFLHLCIARKDQLVGMMGFVSPIAEPAAYVEVGYWAGAAIRGQGLTTAALSAFCKYAFNTFPHIMRLEAVTFAHNTASQRVLEKAGFTRDAVLKKRARLRDGTVVDDILFGKLRT